MVSYGLLDTVDHCWIGDDHGPKLYTEKWIAKVSARVLDVMVGNDPGRTRAAPFPAQKLKYKDRLEAKMSALEALQALEEGRVL